MTFPTAECMEVIDQLLEYNIAAMFANPVDPVRDRCPNYLNLIKEPMDLGTVKKRLQSGHYKSVNDWKHDMELIWNNSYTFNKSTSILGAITRDLHEKYNQLVEYIGDNSEICWRIKLNCLTRDLNEIMKEAPKIPNMKKKKGSRRDEMRNSISVEMVDYTANNQPLSHEEIVSLADDIKKIQSNSQTIAIMNMLKKLEPAVILDPDHIDIDLCTLQPSTLHALRAKLDDFIENS